MTWETPICHLVGGLEHVLFFHFIYGMSSFPLTNSIIFQRGKSTTNQIYIYIPSLTIINHYFFWLIMFIFFRGIGQPSHSHIPHRVTMVFLINRQGCWAIRSLMEVLCTESRRTRTWWFFLDSPWLRKPRYQWIGLRENLQETMVLNMFKSINQWEYLKYF